ncbi:MAG TPA: AAA family ATPase, partial [Candidatus Hydrogenedentes bacterium]|nr:AAA family ATPase [Candidatus Hydrogenedentota bacterium]
MRFIRARIDGYGRLSGTEFTFSPGLQIILGPNERGKSTLRCCITDLLFGQRQEDGSYDEANLLRQPWHDPETYGGALTYTLDNGETFIIERTFHAHRERISVINGASGLDITDNFPRLSHGWPGVGETHLGISRSAFIGAATISHFSLDDLGGQGALSGIRDRLLAVADSGGGGRSAEKALRQLEQWARALNDDSETRGPIPLLKKRLRALKDEAEVCSATMEQRRGILARLRLVRQRRDELEGQIQDLGRRWERARFLDRKRRYEEARRILEQLDEARKMRFELAPYRDTPIETLENAQRLQMRVETIRLQIERERQELSFLEREWEAGIDGANFSSEALKPIPESLERAQHELAAEEQRFVERAEQIQEQLDQVQKQIVQIQQKLADLPDFSRMAGQAIDWLSQLQQLAETAKRQLDQHRETCRQLRQETARARDAIREDLEIFSDFDSFADRLKHHEEATEKSREEKIETEKLVNHLLGALEESAEQLPGLWGLNALCAVVLVGLALTYLITFRLPVLYPLAIVTVAQAYYLYSIFRAYGHRRAMEKQLSDAQAKLDALARSEQDNRSPVDDMLQRAGCKTIRELEARY